jgi:phosphoglycolate phosphatase
MRRKILLTLKCRGIVFKNIQGIIFDKDGTLANSQEFLRELAQKRARLIDAQIPGIAEPLLMAFGLQSEKLDPTGLMAVGSRLENEIAAAAYIAETGRSWFESMAIARSAFQTADQYFPDRAANSPLFTGSLEVLQSLSLAGLKLGILSADSTVGVQNFVAKHQLTPYIQLTMGVDAGLTKPDPMLFTKACQALSSPPSATLMVGDSQGDIEMAKKAGAAGTIAICWSTSTTNHLKQADVIINELTEIQIDS